MSCFTFVIHVKGRARSFHVHLLRQSFRLAELALLGDDGLFRIRLPLRSFATGAVGVIVHCFLLDDFTASVGTVRCLDTFGAPTDVVHVAAPIDAFLACHGVGK